MIPFRSHHPPPCFSVSSLKTVSSADSPAPEAALHELLGNTASIYEKEDLSVTAPFCRDGVSWPRQAGVVDLMASLPDTDRPVLTKDGAGLP